jgi:hypothetical protein
VSELQRFAGDSHALDHIGGSLCCFDDVSSVARDLEETLEELCCRSMTCFSYLKIFVLVVTNATGFVELNASGRLVSTHHLNLSDSICHCPSAAIIQSDQLLQERHMQPKRTSQLLATGEQCILQAIDHGCRHTETKHCASTIRRE